MWGTKSQLNYTELSGHLLSANANKLLHLTTRLSTRQPALPSPHRWNPVLKGFRLLLSQFLGSSVLDYSHPEQWLVSASRPRLLTQMGVRACDGFHMSHRSCKCVLFLNVFLSISHLFLCFALSKGLNREVGEGQTWYPLIHFSAKREFSPSLKPTYSLNDYFEVKADTFYCPKADRR